MYDTINLWKPRMGSEDISPLLARLSNKKEIREEGTGDVITVGSVGAMKVRVGVGAIRISGSLPKYIYPDNSYTMTRRKTREAVERLSDELSYDVGKMNVSRIDFADTFVMRHPAQEYFERLEQKPRCTRCQYENTLYYNNSGHIRRKTLAFYDKTKEVDSRGDELPNVMQRSNLLRYEARYQGKLAQLMNVPEVKGSTLADEKFYEDLVQRWADDYFSIEKRQTAAEKMKIKTAGEGKDFLLYSLLNLSTTTTDDVLREIKSELNTNTYYRLKKGLSDIRKKFSEGRDELIKELDDDVRQHLIYRR